MIRFSMIYALGITLGLSLSGCASSPKAQEYSELENHISSLHENSIFKDDGQHLFTPQTVDVLRETFAEKYCASGVSEGVCAKNFDRAAALRLSEIYFAADPSDISMTCSNEPLICDDMISLETLFRRLHNASVEKSKQEKLSQIENWRQGKLTDDQLKAALHLDFKFQDGKLFVRVPSA